MAKYALIIGVSEYQDDQIPDLKKALNDIMGVAQVLKNPQIGDFPESNVGILSNPTYKSAQRAISHFFQSC